MNAMRLWPRTVVRSPLERILDRRLSAGAGIMGESYWPRDDFSIAGTVARLSQAPVLRKTPLSSQTPGEHSPKVPRLAAIVYYV